MSSDLAVPLRRWPVILASGLLVAAVFFRHGAQLFQSLHIDEAYTVFFSNSVATTADDTWPPFYYCLIWLMRQLFGDAEAVLRSASLAATAGSAIICLLAMRRRSGPSAAVFAALGVSAAPLALMYAYMARGYAVLVLCSVVVSWSTLAIAQGAAGRRWPVLWFLSAWVAVGVHHFGGLLLLGSYLVLVTLHLRGEACRRYHIWVAALWLSLGPWCLVAVRQLQLGVRAITASRYIQLEQMLKHFGPGAAIAWVPVQVVAGLMLLALVLYGSRARQSAPGRPADDRSIRPLPRTQPTLALGLPAALYAATLATAMVAGGTWAEAAPGALLLTATGGVLLFFGWRLLPGLPLLGWRWLRQLHPLAQLLLVTLLVISIACAIKPLHTTRNLMVLLPGYWMLAGVGFSSLPRRWQRIAAVGVAAALIASWWSFEKRYGTWEDWRGAVVAANELRQAGDAVAIRPAWAAPMLSYYGVEQPPVYVNRGKDLCRWMRPGRSIVVVSSLWHHVYASASSKADFAEAVASCARVLDRRELRGMRVLRLAAPENGG